MSDGRLRELERAWKLDSTGESAVAYLAELLRAGEVRRAECVLAWRLGRAESVLSGDVAGVVPMGTRLFEADSPWIAGTVLEVLFGPVGVLNAVRAPQVAREQRVVTMLNPPVSCQTDGRHLGPIDYDALPPRCERCGGHPQDAPLSAACWAGVHAGPYRETTAGTACGACGEVVTPVRSNP